MDTDRGWIVLRAAKEALEPTGIPWWVDCGTLLGAVRERNLLAHDLDLDIGCPAPELHLTVHEALVGAGFVEGRTHGAADHGYQQCFFLGEVKLDVFYFYSGTVVAGERVPDPTCSWQGSWLDEHLIVSEFPADALMPRSTVAIGGEFFPAPGDPVAVLEARYGPDWRTPVLEWDWARDPACITDETRPV